jgi:hypothetical protein
MHIHTTPKLEKKKNLINQADEENKWEQFYENNNKNGENQLIWTWRF